MSEINNDLLVVGSGLEAQLALNRLEQLEFGGRLLHLPTTNEPTRDFSFCPTSAFGEYGFAAPSKARLADVWGKSILSLKLPAMRVVEPSQLAATSRSVTTLAQGLKVNRTQQTGPDVTVTLSDGTELLCQGVLFCDGEQSQCQAFWSRPLPSKPDPHSTRCWTFFTRNLLDFKVWEFRWATAKSVEVVPVSEELLRVSLRFKSRYGGKLSITELKELFSEFGSDMTALFENVGEDEIKAKEESGLQRSEFSPAKGCVALGRAAWVTTPLLTFDWLSQCTTSQLEILIEQLRTGRLNPDSFDAQAQRAMEEFQLRERFLRRNLHSDNALLRPLRNLLLKLLPNPFLAGQIKKRLFSNRQS